MPDDRIVEDDYRRKTMPKQPQPSKLARIRADEITKVGVRPNPKGEFSSKVTIMTERGNAVEILYTASDPEQDRAVRDLQAEFERLSSFARRRGPVADDTLW